MRAMPLSGYGELPMARRVGTTLWTRSLQSTLLALTRAAVKVATQATRSAVKQALKPAPKRPAARSGKRAASRPVQQAAKPMSLWPALTPASWPPRAPVAAATKAPTCPPSAAGALPTLRTKPAVVPLKVPPPGLPPVPVHGATTPGATPRIAADNKQLTTSGVALCSSGARRYRLYKPPGASLVNRMPLLVMLHGCGQDAVSFARCTRINRLAARVGFFVLWPEQDRMANAQGCWNWFETRSRRAYSEAASVIAAIDQVCALFGADSNRVAVAGLSAGASLAGLLATRYPERFKAVAMHSGIAPGTAQSSATALAAMQGRRNAEPLPLTLAGQPGLPPLLVIHGSLDPLVRPATGRAAVQLWATAAGARAGAPRITQRAKRYKCTVTDFRCRSRIVASLCEVSGLGHAWSGGLADQPYSDAKGPDASRLIWAFAARQFRTADAAALRNNAQASVQCKYG